MAVLLKKLFGKNQEWRSPGLVRVKVLTVIVP